MFFIFKNMSKKTIIVFSLAFCFSFLIFHSVAGNILQFGPLTDTFSPTLEKVEINPVSLATDNYFVMLVSVSQENTEISSVTAVLKSPSQKDTVNVILKRQGQSWNSSFTIPSSYEKGQWSVWEINVIDQYLRTKKYSKEEINTTFLYGVEHGLDSSNENVLNEQKKQECIQNNGVWDEETKACACLPNYELQDSGICLFVPPCVFTYSPWSECQSNGTQTRTVISSSNCSNTDKPVLTQKCDYVSSLEELFKKKVEELNTVQKIVDYLNNNFKLVAREGDIAYFPKDFFEKKEGGEQDFAVFTSYVLNEHNFVSFTFAYEYENDNQRGIRYVTSVRDTNLPKYIYFDESGVYAVHYGWSFRDLCRKEEERLGIKILRYGTVSPTSVDLNPQEWVIFREESNAEDDERLIEKCNFIYSSWSECQIDGTRTRNVISFFPENCEGGEPKLTENCNYVKPIIPCIFTYSPWSECQPNGIQTRKLISKMPANCSEGDPVLAQSCAYIEPVKPETDPVVTPTATPTTTSLTAPTNTISDIISQTPGNAKEKLKGECLRAGINNEEDCDIFNYQAKIVPECLSLGLTNQDQCRDYFLSNYGKPLKCKTLSDENCAKLIDDVILSALEKSIDEEKKNELIQVSGSKAVINVVNNSPVISIPELEEKKEIKMENLPISVKEDESISVKLIPIETNESQKGLSPVAISISSEGNDLPDDVIARIGQDFKIETLSGVDRAIVEGKPLEQPKFNSFKGESLIVESVETEEKGSLVIRGKSNPGEIITLFIYSSMPIVVTVQADQDGNWIYTLDKSMVDGTHEVYAVLHNDEGRIIEASTPKIFFVAETQAVSMEEMLLSGNISEVKDDPENMMTLYLWGGISIIIILIALLLIAKRKTE